MNTTLLVSSNQAWNVLHELVRLRAPLEAPPFNALLTELGRRGDVNGMTTVLAEMRESDIMPEVGTLVILVNQLCKLGRVDEAMEVFDKIGRLEEGLHLMEPMKSTKGLAPNTVTYNCLDDGFSKVGEIEIGKELFDQMNEEGVSPNVVSLNALVVAGCLIYGFCKAGRMGDANDVLSQFKQAGFLPDIKCYNALVNGLCKKNMFKQAGFLPDIKCYNALVNGLCKKNMVDKAYEIIKEMKSGDLALALRVMKRMIKDGLVPTTDTYRSLLHACCLNGKTKGAMKLFTDMSSISMIPPNTITYNILIESLCKHNEVKSRFIYDGRYESKWGEA
ncbi:hypothetical protein PVK06_038050 [Gossypium arboreum]|uniref:Pentatricopeptide repeat-containing protein n=1 Tax=Gossypium arboreum TaxID=29729 RepID=A0ABR0MZ40_GOSAR|nr:hypothetical protein PVK06_038050 [Gossypium arboreum]